MPPSWRSSTLVFKAPEDDAAHYIAAVTIAVDHRVASSPTVSAHARVTVQLAMARVKDELCLRGSKLCLRGSNPRGSKGR
nr:unnamed protein product [Digitaria exilis]